ncbi:hypothetical protein BD410DRAFT_713344 [Rickenella mellea]|uniref:WHIM1 domain-containing protein n=1 Tax=Rickenella mellea TaxID=50990 RepID=A0A4Y7QMD0_9AGAM|nr:hypothetical protein BD410DRAFT_713344 [Rickenella mellea]
MKPATTTPHGDKKGHICPPSNATHPSDRWETAFVYAFITKFTNLKAKIEGFENPMDLEDALLSPLQHPILVAILSYFIRSLKPQTRNLSADHISSTVSMVLQEYMKSSERTLFWNDELKTNVDPLQGIVGGFWGADWDLKLRILRQLVELQLSHHAEIRDTIDRAWGVVHNKHKKKEGTTAPPDPSHPLSQEKLATVPVGQDAQRKRFWVMDDSPRIYVSTNPWKTTSGFKTIATTKEEYLHIIQGLKDGIPKDVIDKKRKPARVENYQVKLVEQLESRIEAIDTELARVSRVRKKIEQREMLKAQAIIRETRTRRQTRRPDYVYNHEADSEDDGDEYTFQDEDEDDEHIDDGLDYDSAGPSRRAVGHRRSQRTAVLNANGKRMAADTSSEWRGERRSSRLGYTQEPQIAGPSVKRARTEESTISNEPSEAASQSSDQKSLQAKVTGAAAVKPNEIVLEQVAGKKKSKFWFYAVAPGSAPPGSNLTTNGVDRPSNDAEMRDGGSSDHAEHARSNGNGGMYEDSVSPNSYGGAAEMSIL